MTHASEKPKNDMDKSEFSGYKPERGLFLTLYLIFAIVVNLYAFYSLYQQADELIWGSESLLPMLALPYAIQSVLIICLVGVWKWKKWGCYGLILAYIISIGLMIASQNYTRAGSSVIGLVVFLLLVGSRIEMFE